jgi:hypothetical protein
VTRIFLERPKKPYQRRVPAQFRSVVDPDRALAWLRERGYWCGVVRVLLKEAGDL